MKQIIRLGLVLFLMAAMFLSMSPAVYADDPADEDSEMKVDVEVDGDLEVDIKVSGPAELNVEARGPSEVDINTDDQVDLNVEAIDPAEVTVNQQKIAEPLQSNEQNDKLVPIVAGTTIPILGLLSFFIIRRKKSKGVKTVR